MEKALLDLKEVCEYLGLGQTKTREIMKDSNFSLKIGNRLYANKLLLDRWILDECKKGI
jgi:predicted DNA-binding transcriptional regulator AlpA